MRKTEQRRERAAVLVPSGATLQTLSVSSSVEINRLRNRTMSEKNPIRLYVTHAFASHTDYHRVFEYFEAVPNFFYRNCSVPDHPPSMGGKEALKEEYRKQMKMAEVVVVLSSLYVENEYWTMYQMDAAQAANLPLVAVEPFGVSVKVPPEVVKRAAEVVGWNERLIVDAVRRQARHEETHRWDTIEFKL